MIPLFSFLLLFGGICVCVCLYLLAVMYVCKNTALFIVHSWFHCALIPPFLVIRGKQKFCQLDMLLFQITSHGILELSPINWKILLPPPLLLPRVHPGPVALWWGREGGESAFYSPAIFLSSVHPAAKVFPGGVPYGVFCWQSKVQCHPFVHVDLKLALTLLILWHMVRSVDWLLAWVVPC